MNVSARIANPRHRRSEPVVSSRATHSTWWVIGNRSKARRSASAIAGVGEVGDVAGQGGGVAGDVRHGARSAFDDGSHHLALGPRTRRVEHDQVDAPRGARRSRGRPGPAPPTRAGGRRGSALARSAACRSPSMAVTAPSGPTASARKAVNSPTPAYRSSTRSPGCGASICITVSTSIRGAPRVHLPEAVAGDTRSSCEPMDVSTCSTVGAGHRVRAPRGARSGTGPRRPPRANGACAGPCHRREGGRTASGCARRDRPGPRGPARRPRRAPAPRAGRAARPPRSP